MYRDDMSTSSEDDTTSTAGGGARAASTPRTADMCADIGVRKGVKILGCTGCGYESDRRANVTRHYRRIHLQLAKHRKCLCGEKFQTKCELYKHRLGLECKWAERQSSYTAKKKYKINQTQTQQKSFTRPKRRVGWIKQPASSYPTRSSTRLRRQQLLSDRSDHSSTISCNSSEEAHSMTTVEPMSTSCSSATSTSSLSHTESFSTSYSSENDSPLKKTEQSFDGYRSNDHLLPLNFNHLPIKKRYLTERRLHQLGDITNNNVEVQKIDWVKFDNKFRAYISHIDFDKLDALL